MSDLTDVIYAAILTKVVALELEANGDVGL
jgi:hypothetical protein